MKITSERIGDGAVVAIEGSLDSVTSAEAKAAFEGLIVEGVEKVAINFEKVDYVSSAGLGVLLAIAKKLNDAGGDIRLFRLRKSVRYIFDASNFSSILKIFRSEEDALDRFID